jgi:hypothetical protein
MSCKCGAHFCWTCNIIYTLNDINDHYTGHGIYGNGCRGNRG